jgi:hypothetical protein
MFLTSAVPPIRAVGHSNNTLAARSIRLNQVQDHSAERILHLLQELGAGNSRPPTRLNTCSAAWLDGEHHHITDNVSSYRRQGNVAARGD